MVAAGDPACPVHNIKKGVCIMEKCPYCNGKGYIEAYCCNARDMVESDWIS